MRRMCAVDVLACPRCGSREDPAGLTPSLGRPPRRAQRAEIETYLDTVHRVGALGHVSSDEAYEEMREAGAIDENPVEWAERIFLIKRAKTLLLA